MKKNPRWLWLSAALAVAAVGIAASVSAAASSGPSGTLHVRGTQTVVSEDAGTSRMHGTLVGGWLITSFTPTFESKSLFVAVGTERFRGCVDSNRNRSCQTSERHGRMTFDYVYWANYNPITGAFLRGQCVHPVTGGSGGFAGASGLLLMHDTVHGDAVVTTYHGQLQFGGSAAAPVPPAIAKVATPSAAGAASSVSRHLSC